MDIQSVILDLLYKQKVTCKELKNFTTSLKIMMALRMQ